MDIFTTNSLIIIASIFVIGIAIAPIVQNVWIIRILIASYISLSSVFLMPDNFIFNTYANIIYFFVIVVVLTVVKSGRFFDAPAWSIGRFSLESIGFSILTIFFIVAIICVLVPLANLNMFMTKETYHFFNTYIFYIAIAPLIFSILFSSRLRA